MRFYSEKNARLYAHSCAIVVRTQRTLQTCLAELPHKFPKNPQVKFEFRFYPVKSAMSGLGRFRVLRVKTCNLRVTCKTHNLRRKMYEFTRNYE